MKNLTDGALLVFDFPNRRGEPRRLCLADPLKVIEANSADEVRPALRAVQEEVEAGFHAGGFVSYEAAPAFDAALAVREGSRAPLLWFGIFKEPARRSPTCKRGEFRVSEWTPSVDARAYGLSVEALREAIARGDTYQANYTFRLRARFEGDHFAFYEQLAARQGVVAHCAYLDTGRFKILSASPELFFRRHGREIVTRPMKGTARRGLWPEEDEFLAAWLAGSEKNRAENVMIVDLLRNDLGRIAQTGSVRVDELFLVERYPTVFQMTSTISARVEASVQLEDVFAALFPCGSVTGAPKVSTMRLIAALEDSPRNVYCGSVGFVTPRGEAVFNVAIRTVLIDGETGEAEYGVGGGITWDSDAEDEYGEALTKAAPLTADWPRFQLLETLRLEGGEFVLLERHLRRLEQSARYFNFTFAPESARQSLEAHAKAFSAGARRVRLLVSEGGEVRVESVPLDTPTPGALPVAVAATPVSRSDRFLYHKTTHRAVYDLHRARHPDAFDVLLWNEDGEVTEFTSGNLVVELDGRRLTPPRECGLLAGTLRAELLERGEIEERVVTRSDLLRASRLWLINSVRGWVPVYLKD